MFIKGPMDSDGQAVLGITVLHSTDGSGLPNMTHLWPEPILINLDNTDGLSQQIIYSRKAETMPFLLTVISPS